jgi:hypothetical protein
MQLAMVAAGFTRRRGRPAAPGHGCLGPQGRTDPLSGQARCRHAGPGLRAPILPKPWAARSRASGATAFRNPTLRASPCWCTYPPGSNASSLPPFCAGCSTASRWVSTVRPNSSRMPVATAWKCCRQMQAWSDWECTQVPSSSRPARIRPPALACVWSRDSTAGGRTHCQSQTGYTLFRIGRGSGPPRRAVCTPSCGCWPRPGPAAWPGTVARPCWAAAGSQAAPGSSSGKCAVPDTMPALPAPDEPRK